MYLLRSASRALLFAAALSPILPLVLSGPRLLAQSDTSSLSGTVTDSSGAVLPNAKVTVTNDATGLRRDVTTNSVGAYTITNLPSGNYTVTVASQGFQTAVQQGTHLDPSIGAQVNVSLKSGNTSTTVTVQADANRLQTESAAVGQLVTAEQVKSIQLNGRNPLYLSQLEPGVTRNAPMSSFNFSLDNTLYVNGSRSEENILAFDGAPMVPHALQQQQRGRGRCGFHLAGTSPDYRLSVGVWAYLRRAGSHHSQERHQQLPWRRLRIPAQLVLQCQHLDS